MKTKNLWFFAIAIPFLFTGCVSTPRLVGPPVVVGSTNYTVAQPPVKLDVANKGPQWNRFVRGYNQERLDSNLRLAEIEYRGTEQARAKQLGVEYTPSALGQQPQVIQQQSVAYPTTTAIYPTGYPYPGASGSAIYPTGYPYPGASGSAIYPTGYPYPGGSGSAIYPTGYGNRWWQFFGGPGITTTYDYNAVGVGGFSFWSGLAGGGDPCRVQKVYKWQSSPGYRHFWR